MNWYTPFDIMRASSSTIVSSSSLAEIGFALVVCLATSGTAQAQTIPVINSGFESNVLNCSGPSCYQLNVVPGWSATGESSTFRPTVGPGGQFPGGIPEGVNGAAAGDQFGPGALLQDLGFAPSSNTTYTLSAYVGQRTEYLFVAYSVELLVGTTSVASDTSLRPLPGTFSLDTVTYSSGNSPGTGHLFIRLSGSGGGQACFDKVSLSAKSSSSTTPSISPSGVLSASAFGGFSVIAPGSFIEIYGSNLAANTRSWGGADFNGNNAPIVLDGTSATIDGQAVFVNFISPGQINVQVPSNVVAGQRSLLVKSPAGTTAAYSVTVRDTNPGILAPSSFVIGGKQYAVALFADNTYVLPPGAISGVSSRRAKPGDIIVLYGVGFGPVNPLILAGQIAQQSNRLVSNLQVSIGGIPATVTYGGLSPGYVGLYQINVTIPNVTANDFVPLTFTLGGVAGVQSLFLSVQN